MSGTIYGALYAFVMDFLAKGWTDDLQISFKKSIMNDIKNHPVKLVSIPVLLLLTLSLFTTALVFIVYGLSHWLIVGDSGAIVNVITGGILALISAVSAAFFMRNVQFIFKRVEYVQNTFVEVKQMTPVHQLYQQIKKEQKMFLDAFTRKTPTKEYV